MLLFVVVENLVVLGTLFFSSSAVSSSSVVEETALAWQGVWLEPNKILVRTDTTS